jgi:hypothetical protein
MAEPSILNRSLASITVTAMNFNDANDDVKCLLQAAFAKLKAATQKKKCLGVLLLTCGKLECKVVAISGNDVNAFGNRQRKEAVQAAVNDYGAIVAPCASGRSELLDTVSGGLTTAPGLSNKIKERISQLLVLASGSKGTLPTPEQLYNYLLQFKYSYLVRASGDEISLLVDLLLDKKKTDNLVMVLCACVEGVPRDVAASALQAIQRVDILTDYTLDGLNFLYEDDLFLFILIMQDASISIQRFKANPDYSELTGFFNLVAAAVDPDQDPVASGKVFAFFSQCAEDNAAVHLLHWIDDNLTQLRDAFNDGSAVDVKWYSTHKAVDGKNLEHKPLCPVCETVFERRLEDLIKRRLALTAEAGAEVPHVGEGTAHSTALCADNH